MYLLQPGVRAGCLDYYEGLPEGISETDVFRPVVLPGCRRSAERPPHGPAASGGVSFRASGRGAGQVPGLPFPGGKKSWCRGCAVAGVFAAVVSVCR